MGLGASRQDYPVPTARSFYLVLGGPPIRFLGRDSPGPLIFNVELARQEGPELIEETGTIRNLVSVGSKHPLKLIAVDPHHPEHGFFLAVFVDAATPLDSVRLYAGAALEAVPGGGLRVSPIRSDQPQFLVYENTDGAAPVGTVGTPLLDSHPPLPPPSTSTNLFASQNHEPILLDHLAPCPPTSELRSPGSLKQCPLLLQIEYTAGVEVEGREGEVVTRGEHRVLYTALSFSASDLERMKSGALQPRSTAPETALLDPPTVRAAVVKQFLECHVASEGGGRGPEKGCRESGSSRFEDCGGDGVEIELYELDDIYDLAGEASVTPASAAPASVSVRCGGDHVDDAAALDERGGTSGAEGAEAVEIVNEVINSDDDDEGDTCVVCLTNAKDTLIIPCRHLCLCSECAALLRQQSNKCPICRQTISRFMTRRV